MIKQNVQPDSPQTRQTKETEQTESVITEFDFGAGHIKYIIGDPYDVLDQDSSFDSSDELVPSQQKENHTDNQKSAQLINVPKNKYPLGICLFYFFVAFLLLLLL